MSTFMTEAKAGISFSQYRISLDDKNRNSSLLVMNDDKVANRCNIGFSHQQVQLDGDTKPVATSKEIFNSADAVLRYSPKRVTIKPRASQTVRLSLKRKKNQKKGEYISYLKLSCRIDNKTESTTGNTVAAQINYNIPVIARIGKLHATVEISMPKVNNNKQLSFTMNRTGNRSLHGNVTVTDSNTGKIIGSYNGLAMYLPIEKQQFQINLTKQPKGSLLIEFAEIAQSGGDQEASLTFNIK